MEVHFVNAYFNYVASRIGIAPRNDAFILFIEGEISQHNRRECLNTVMATIDPSRLATVMADDYLPKIKDAVASADLDVNRAFGGEELSRVFNITKNLAQASLDQEFGSVPTENFLLPLPDDDLYRYQLGGKPG